MTHHAGLHVGMEDRWIEAIRSEKIEFIVVQHPWLENDCTFADLILPVTTPFEEDDILVSWGTKQSEKLCPYLLAKMY